MPTPKDPTEPIRLAASQLPEVDAGTACTQTSFKAGKKAFLFCGPQGKRYKAMFKLDASRAEAERLAAADPDRFDVGAGPWITARFTADDPMPKKLWKKWLDESYALTIATPAKKTSTRKTKVSKKSANKAKTTKRTSTASKKPAKASSEKRKTKASR